MTPEWSGSTDERLFLLYNNLPDALKGALNKAWHQHYEELYESETEGIASLQDVLNEILDAFQGSDRTLSHIRYVWMALILAIVVEPTVEYYQPNSSIPDETIFGIELWLLETLKEMVYLKEEFPGISTMEEANNNIIDSLREFNSEREIASFQVLSEALDVFVSAAKSLDPNQSLNALLDILDDCLEGYAIFSGSNGRRELFNWWLLEVVPASWYLLPPSSIYSINKSENQKRIVFQQMNKLKKISSQMWAIISENSQSWMKYISRAQALRPYQRIEYYPHALDNCYRTRLNFRIPSDSHVIKMARNVKLKSDRFSRDRIQSIYKYRI